MSTNNQKCVLFHNLTRYKKVFVSNKVMGQLSNCSTEKLLENLREFSPGIPLKSWTFPVNMHVSWKWAARVWASRSDTAVLDKFMKNSQVQECVNTNRSFLTRFTKIPDEQVSVKASALPKLICFILNQNQLQLNISIIKEHEFEP